jgi:hypothetical protein
MRKLLLKLVLLFFFILSRSSLGQGTAFNYQGQLNTTTGAANGNYDFQFGLYAGSNGGSPTTPMVTNSAVAVLNGSFTTAINFGANVFTGATNWLDIAVRTNGNGGFTELTPRQQILPVPYAIYAANAGTAVSALTASNAAIANSANTATTANYASTAGSATTAGTAGVANSVAPGAINGSSIAAGTLTAADLAPGQVVTNFNGLTGGINLVATNNLTVTTSGTNVIIGGGGDFLYAYLFAQSQNITGTGASGNIPVTTVTTNGWGWNGSYSSPVFTVPHTGFYLIHFEALPSSSYPAIGAYYNVGTGSYSPIPGSLGSSSPLSHSFITYLTAGDNLVIANATSGTLQLLTTLNGASSDTLFSVSITRIN